MTPTITASVEARIFSRARWIWPDSFHWDIVNGYALFRKAFDLATLPRKAPLFITADQSYRLYVNGCYVSRGPARGFQASWPYDEVDVRPFLKPGRNLIAVRAYNPGFSNFQYLTQGFAGLLVAARWGKTEIVTDASWKALRQPGIRRDTVVSSVQLFPQEHIDLRATPADWARPGFDDSSWIKPDVRPWNGGPWFGLEPRGIPLLEERDIFPAAVIGIGEGRSDPAYSDCRDVVTLRQREDRSHRPAQAGLAPLAIAATGAGKFSSYLIDFGKPVVGSLIFEITGAAGGEIVDTHLVETIDAATLTPDLTLPAHCRMAFGDRLTLRSGANAHSFFHHYGFRYLQITVRDASQPLRLNVRLRWVGYPLPRHGAFVTSDTTLADIWETCAWTQQGCSLDAYVDTPWREQAQWWGDARVQAWNTFHLNGDTRLFRRGIRQIGSQATPDGVTYGHAPTMAHSCILPDFTIIWFLTIWDYYFQTGSTEPLTTHLPAVEKALGYFRDHTDPKSGLITYDDRFWLFLDWTDIFKDGAPALYNLWLLIALDKLVLLHRAAKRPRDAAPLAAWAKKLRASIGKHLLGKNGLLHDGLDRQGKRVADQSIHTQTLGLLAGIKGLNTAAALDTVILPWLRGETSPKVMPSAYWITYVYGMLIEQGHGAAVIASIRSRWAPMIAQGATSENFGEDRGNGSQSHAWSSHPLYHLMQTVGGLTQTAPAWKAVRFAPVFEGDHGGATIPSPAGKITSRWKRRANEMIDVSLNLPKGVVAEVILPGHAPARVQGRRQWRLSAAT